MIGCPAWKALTNNAQVLYVYMKLQLFGNKKDHLPEGQFYFNGGTYAKAYKLYKNQTQFYQDKPLRTISCAKWQNFCMEKTEPWQTKDKGY